MLRHIYNAQPSRTPLGIHEVVFSLPHAIWFSGCHACRFEQRVVVSSARGVGKGWFPLTINMDCQDVDSE